MDALSVIGALPGMKLKQVCEAVGKSRRLHRESICPA
jgi:hypothetical protein